MRPFKLRKKSPYYNWLCLLKRNPSDFREQQSVFTWKKKQVWTNWEKLQVTYVTANSPLIFFFFNFKDDCAQLNVLFKFLLQCSFRIIVKLSKALKIRSFNSFDWMCGYTQKLKKENKKQETRWGKNYLSFESASHLRQTVQRGRKTNIWVFTTVLRSAMPEEKEGSTFN